MTRKKTQLYIALAPLVIALVGIGSWGWSFVNEKEPNVVKPSGATDTSIATTPKLRDLAPQPIATISDGSEVAYVAEEPSVASKTPITPVASSTSGSSAQPTSAASTPRSTSPLLSVDLRHLLQLRIP